MRARVVLLLVVCLFVTSGSIVNAQYQICGKEFYQYYYTDATFTTQVGHCAQNDGCTGYDYCSGTTNTEFRVWETASCCRPQGGCNCQQLIDGVWTPIPCPAAAPCY